MIHILLRGLCEITLYKIKIWRNDELVLVFFLPYSILDLIHRISGTSRGYWAQLRTSVCLRFVLGYSAVTGIILSLYSIIFKIL